MKAFPVCAFNGIWGYNGRKAAIIPVCKPGCAWLETAYIGI